MPVTVTDHEGTEHRYPTANAPIAEPDGRLLAAVDSTGQTVAVYPANSWRRAVVEEDEVAEPVELYVPVAARVAWDGAKLRALYLRPHEGEVGSEQYPDGKGRPLTIEDVRAEVGEEQAGEVEFPDGRRSGVLDDPPLRVADVRDDGDRFAEELLDDLRRLGDTYGPLGVALAASTLTDPQALVRAVVDAHGGAEVLQGVPHPADAEPDGYEANLDALRAEVARLSGLLDEPVAEVATYRREVEEQTARAETEHASRLRAERMLADRNGQLDALRGHLDAERARAEEAETNLDLYRRRLAHTPVELSVAGPGVVTCDGRVLSVAYGEQAPGVREGVVVEAPDREETNPHPIEEDPRRPHLDAYPSDALLLTYAEVRKLLALHIAAVADSILSPSGQARAMRDGETPLRLAEVLA